MKPRPPVVVSACLLGAACRWDGTDRRDPRVEAAVRGRPVVSVCPEELGGLGTPRPQAELRGGDGTDALSGRARVAAVGSDRDVTDRFLAGAWAALAKARRRGAEAAILKEGSPSCGVHRIRREGARVRGRGVLAALLRRSGLAIRSEEDLEALPLAGNKGTARLKA